jgi:predicted nucleotide-binding protein (sugar kinase/HSP70/actin superfamily)
MDIGQKETRNKSGTLTGKTLYIPRMSIEGAACMAAAYRSMGVNGQMVPESDATSLEMARQYTIGEECFPEIVTLGGFLKIITEKSFDPQKTAFLMPTAGGPCRFGQYKSLLEKILEEQDLSEVMVVAPSSANGYEAIGGNAGDLVRLGWWSIVCADALRKLLLQTRPYELNPGETDKIHRENLAELCKLIERPDMERQEKFTAMKDLLRNLAQNYARIPANYSRDKLLVGIVGEIYCRLDDFTNSFLIRRLEKFGAEVWLASISEWVFYTNFMQKTDLRLQGERFSKAMLGTLVRNKIQTRNEHQLLSGLHHRFRGYEEPENIKYLVDLASPYLPYTGALGEMVLNVGGAIHYHHKGADGIIDISPFTCMNGIVCEAIYPRVSRENDNIPIKNFYFDGTEIDYDQDVEIFLELASTYQRNKKVKRIFPGYFPDPTQTKTTDLTHQNIKYAGS